MFWVWGWQQVPASELGYARGAFPASLVAPAPAGIMPWQRAVAAGERVTVERTAATVEPTATGGAAVNLRGGLQGVLNLAQGLLALAAGALTGNPQAYIAGSRAIASVVSVRRAAPAAGAAGELAMPERDTGSPFWEKVEEFTGVPSDVGEERRLITGRGVVVTGPTGESQVRVQTVQGEKTFTVAPADFTPSDGGIAMPTDSSGPERNGGGGGGGPEPLPEGSWGERT